MSIVNEWPMAKLGEVLSLPSRWSRKDTKEYSYIDISSLDSSLKKVTDTQPISSKSAPSRATTHVIKDDVLVSTVRPNLNAVAMVPAVMADGIASSGIAVLRAVPDKINPCYLFHVTQSQFFIQRCCDLATGASYPAVSDAKIRSISIPLPPLLEQQRIAEILDQSQSLINDSLILEEKSETLLKASFIAAFGHPLDPANPINRQRVGAVSKVITGNTPPRKDPSNYGSTVEWLKSDNLGGLQPTPAAELLSDVGARKARLVEPGATLITCIAGSRESIGKSSLLDRTAAFNQQINAIVPGEELDPLFLFAQVKTAPELIRREATDGMKGIVSKKTLESVKILVPSVHAQRQFSEAATKFMSLKDYTQRRTSELRTLHESLSTRAFAGQL